MVFQEVKQTSVCCCGEGVAVTHCISLLEPERNRKGTWKLYGGKHY